MSLVPHLLIAIVAGAGITAVIAWTIALVVVPTAHNNGRRIPQESWAGRQMEGRGWKALAVVPTAPRIRASDRLPVWSSLSRDWSAQEVATLGGDVHSVATGWPLPALVSDSVIAPGFEIRGFRFRGGAGGGVQRTIELRTVGIVTTSPPIGAPRVLSLQPWVPGFIGNTILYGAAVFALLIITSSLRRRRRTMHGTCSSCGFPVGTSSKCVECGAEVIPSDDPSGGPPPIPWPSMTRAQTICVVAIVPALFVVPTLYGLLLGERLSAVPWSVHLGGAFGVLGVGLVVLLVERSRVRRHGRNICVRCMKPLPDDDARACPNCRTLRAKDGVSPWSRFYGGRRSPPADPTESS